MSSYKLAAPIWIVPSRRSLEVGKPVESGRQRGGRREAYPAQRTLREATRHRSSARTIRAVDPRPLANKPQPLTSIRTIWSKVWLNNSAKLLPLPRQHTCKIQTWLKRCRWTKRLSVGTVACHTRHEPRLCHSRKWWRAALVSRTARPSGPPQSSWQAATPWMLQMVAPVAVSPRVITLAATTTTVTLVPRRTLSTSSTTRLMATIISLSITLEALTGIRISRCHPEMEDLLPSRCITQLLRCETQRRTTTTITTTAAEWAGSRPTKLPRKTRRSIMPNNSRLWRRGYHLELESRCSNRTLKTNAKLRWQRECAHALKPETRTRKTQISSEVNYIALYFV